MANELEMIDLKKLSIDDVKRIRNAAVERLKASGHLPLQQQSHQDGTHTNHVNHTTHANSGGGGGGPRPIQPLQGL